jgi:hypothetical protein
LFCLYCGILLQMLLVQLHLRLLLLLLLQLLLLLLMWPGWVQPGQLQVRGGTSDAAAMGPPIASAAPAAAAVPAAPSAWGDVWSSGGVPPATAGMVVGLLPPLQLLLLLLLHL